jgi:hypothetical protein
MGQYNLWKLDPDEPLLYPAFGYFTGPIVTILTKSFFGHTTSIMNGTPLLTIQMMKITIIAT